MNTTSTNGTHTRNFTPTQAYLRVKYSGSAAFSLASMTLASIDVDTSYSVVARGGYRYGFQNQERDDEIKGAGNSLNYEYRMHDPRLGRFFAIDPLSADYPYYSPYQFSGNRLIDAVELEGLEPGLIIGSLRQVEAIGNENKDIAPANQNWAAVHFVTFNQAKIAVQNHKANGNKLKVLLIQNHASSSAFYCFEGPDGRISSEGIRQGEPFNCDDRSINLFQLEGYYTQEMKRINSIKNLKEREKEMQFFKDNPEVQKIEAFIGLVSEIEDGGTCIMNGCNVFSYEDGIRFSKTLFELTGKRVNFIGPADYCSDLGDNQNEKLFGGGLIPDGFFTTGYIKNGESTGQNLQLNATGEKLFEFINAPQ